MSFPFILSLVFGLSLTPAVTRMGHLCNWLDYPDQIRKCHQLPVPRIGGVAIFMAYFSSLGIAHAMSATSRLAFSHLQLGLLGAGALVVFATGFADDLYGLTAAPKLAGQCIAALLVCSAGFKVSYVAGFVLPSVLATSMTILWLVACMNSFNLIDGMDGLAGGIGLIASIAVMIGAILNNNRDLVLLMVPLIGTLLAFLMFNFAPASIYMGDSGSYLVGFLIGTSGLMWAGDSTGKPGLIVPALALSIPLLDTSLSIGRRFLRKAPIFFADRDHIHHRLIDRGLSPKQAAFVFYAAGAVAGLVAVIRCKVSSPAGSLVLVIYFGIALVGIKQLGYDEFRAAAALFRRLAEFRETLRSRVVLLRCEERISRCTTPEECWNVIIATSRDLGFSSAALSFGEHAYDIRLRPISGSDYRLDVPLSDNGYARFTYSTNAGVRGPSARMELVELLQRVVTPQIQSVRNDVQSIAVQPSMQAPDVSGELVNP